MSVYRATPEKISGRADLFEDLLAPTRGIDSPKIVLGWREWVALPSVSLPAVKAKIDTGARTSALHAWFVDSYREKGSARVRFGIHPLQGNTDLSIECHADVADEWPVTDSGGHREKRLIIVATLAIAGIHSEIEISLTNRDTMRFRMLLGRTAMRGRFLVDPRASYATGRALRKTYSDKQPP